MSAQLPLFAPRDPSSAWQVRVSRRARRLSVRVYPGGHVEVVVPPGASAVSVQRFIGQHRAWIDKRVNDLAPTEMPAAHLPTVVDLPFLGRSYLVEYQETTGAARVREGTQHSLIVTGAIADRTAVCKALRRWLIALAYRELGAGLQRLAGELQVTYDRVQIRRQRTRWGSCSMAGTISLNVCSLFLDAPIVRYLLVHELCHTRQMNHSSRFWSLVASHEPDYRRLDRELSKGWQHVPGWMFVQ